MVYQTDTHGVSHRHPKGFRVSLYRDVFYGAYFLVYEASRRLLIRSSEGMRALGGAWRVCVCVCVCV